MGQLNFAFCICLNILYPRSRINFYAQYYTDVECGVHVVFTTAHTVCLPGFQVHLHYTNAATVVKLFTDSENIKILLDRDKFLQLSRDPKKLAVVSGVADVSQDNFLLIQFPHFKVLKQTI